MIVVAVALAILALPYSVAAQIEVPDDTYSDIAVANLLDRARATRQETIEGIDSYEGKLRQRIYVGLTAFRFRRERGLFEHERIAWIRWSADGERIIQWQGVRTAIPIAGIDTGGDNPSGVIMETDDSTASVTLEEGLQQDIAEDLLDETDMPAFGFDPNGDELRFGDDDFALNPLADSAVLHYRFISGDTLRVELPANERNVALYEVLVEPRRADFNLIAGSLWFDSETASLVRATYKPARPFNMAIDEPEETDEVPGFLQPVEAEIDYITVEYSLQELRFWLPRRFAFQGEARMGSVLAIPITLEWSIGSYLVNEPETTLFAEGELPEGWRRQENVDFDEDIDEEVRTIVIVPTNEELTRSPELSETFGERSPITFGADEISQLERRLEGLLPTYRRFRPSFNWGLQRGLLRYNRVEGMSVGGLTTIPLTPSLDFEATGRIGFGDWEPNVSAALLWGPPSGRWTLEGYRRLTSMADDHDPFSMKASMAGFFFGDERGEYYRATGASLGYRSEGNRVRYEVEGFYEQQRPISLGTEFFFFDLVSDQLIHPLLSAEPLDVHGGRGTLSWFTGIDPNSLIVTGRIDGEAGFGDAEYQRLSGALSATHPLPFDLAGAIEVGAGTSWGVVPLQREFFLGGSSSLRGFYRNAHHGDSFWRGRAEVATGFAAARLSLFTDWGWTGPRGDFAFDDPFASVGIGASLLDGLFRIDFARAVRRETRWKMHLYLDGLF